MKFKFLRKGLVMVVVIGAFFLVYFFAEDLCDKFILLIGIDVDHFYDLTMNRSIPIMYDYPS